MRDEIKKFVKGLRNIKYKITTIVLITIVIATLGCEGNNTPPPGTRFGTGQILNAGEQIISPNGYYALTMQTDGNLVLYHLPANPSNSKWASCTQLRGGSKATLRDTGEFVVLDGNGNTLWSSGTKGYTQDYLMLQDDGNLVIYAATNNSVWKAGISTKDALNSICNIGAGNPIR